MIQKTEVVRIGVIEAVLEVQSAGIESGFHDEEEKPAVTDRCTGDGAEVAVSETKAH